jgi:predicted nuclease of predicted toxin-antitoxin system
VQFLADESCHFAFVRALREAGHDAQAVAETMRGAADPVVMELARHEGRILLTEDRDFGTLVFARTRATGGVIYLRYPASALTTVAQTLVALVADRSGDLTGAFVVVQPGRVRLARDPGA